MIIFQRNYSKKRGLDGKPMFADREITDKFSLDENDEIMSMDEEHHFLSLKNASTGYFSKAELKFSFVNLKIL